METAMATVSQHTQRVNAEQPRNLCWVATTIAETMKPDKSLTVAALSDIVARTAVVGLEDDSAARVAVNRNTRRRVYDALKVLAGIKCIRKEGKVIHWDGTARIIEAMALLSDPTANDRRGHEENPSGTQETLAALVAESRHRLEEKKALKAKLLAITNKLTADTTDKVRSVIKTPSPNSSLGEEVFISDATTMGSIRQERTTESQLNKEWSSFPEGSAVRKVMKMAMNETKEKKGKGKKQTKTNEKGGDKKKNKHVPLCRGKIREDFMRIMDERDADIANGNTQIRYISPTTKNESSPKISSAVRPSAIGDVMQKDENAKRVMEEFVRSMKGDHAQRSTVTMANANAHAQDGNSQDKKMDRKSEKSKKPMVPMSPTTDKMTSSETVAIKERMWLASEVPIPELQSETDLAARHAMSEWAKTGARAVCNAHLDAPMTAAGGGGDDGFGSGDGSKRSCSGNLPAIGLDELDDIDLMCDETFDDSWCVEDVGAVKLQ